MKITSLTIADTETLGYTPGPYITWPARYELQFEFISDNGHISEIEPRYFPTELDVCDYARRILTGEISYEQLQEEDNAS